MTDVKANPTVPVSFPLALLRKMGVDRAIAYSVLSRVWGTMSGPVTMYLVIRFLSAEQQGYYYTFGNVLGLTVIFELGLVMVISQFASHEMAKLQFMPDGTLQGDAKAKGRISTLMYLACRWYVIVGILIICTLIPVGLYFFSSSDKATADVMWRIPWVTVVCTTAASCAVSPIYAVLNGCGLVAQTSRQRLAQQVIGQIALWMAMVTGLGLLSTPVQTACAVAIEIGWLAMTQRKFFKDLLVTSKTTEHRLDWWGEVWPMQWQVALSWVAGYFIYQTFNPVLLKEHGPAIAGQWGMSWVLAHGFAPAASAWINTKAPQFGMLIAKREFSTLNKVFFKATMQSFVLMMFYAVCAVGGLTLLNYIGHPYAKRLLDPFSFSFLALSALINHFVFAEAVYLRAHRSEPFLIPALINAGCVLVSNLTLGKYFGALGMAIGYCGITLVVGFGLGTYVFQSKRKAWHGDVSLEQAVNESGREPT